MTHETRQLAIHLGLTTPTSNARERKKGERKLRMWGRKTFPHKHQLRTRWRWTPEIVAAAFAHFCPGVPYVIAARADTVSRVMTLPPQTGREPIPF
jgi:hypothetical protein